MNTVVYSSSTPRPVPAPLPENEHACRYDFYLELRPPNSSDLVPSAYVHARGDTLGEATASVRVPDGWAVYAKRRRLIEYRTCRSCGTDEEVKNRSHKIGFGMVAFLDCGHFQNDDEY